MWGRPASLTEKGDSMQIIFKGKLSDWEEIKQTIFKAVGRSDLEEVQEFEEAIRATGVGNVNDALAKAGHEAEIQL